jgi:MFS family permease
MFPVILPLIKADLGLTDVQVGGLMTAKEAASGTLILPSGFMADAFVKHRALILGCAVAMGGIAYLCAGSSSSYSWVLLSLGLLGVASALWHPSAISSLSSHFPDRRGTALALHGVGASIGDTIGPLCVGGLLLLVGWRHLAQWHVIPALLLAFVLWKNIHRVYIGGGSRSSLRSYMVGVKDLISRPSILMVMLASSFVGMARLSIITFLPIYLSEEVGYSSFWLGFHWMLLYAMGMVSQPLMGIISDRFSRKTVLLPAFTIMGLLYLVLPMAGHNIQLAFVIAAMGLFFYGTSNIATAAVLDIAATNVQGTTHSVMTLFRQVFTSPSPIISGLIVTAYGITSVFYYASALLFLAALLWLFIRIPTRSAVITDNNR